MEEHRNLLERLEQAAASEERYKQAIVDAADKIVAGEVLKILADVPVEELNREKRGFRIKTLKEYGYHTAADVASATASELASVRGISEDAAVTMKAIVRQMAGEAGKGVKVRLSTDDQNDAATSLVTAVSCYLQCLAPVKGCSRLFAAQKDRITEQMEALAPAARQFKWLFTFGEKKKKASEAYAFLAELRNGDYWEKALSALDRLDILNRLSGETAWKDFEKNSIRFFKVLEDTVPGLLGTDDSLYGLPEELAREVQDECYYPYGLNCELRSYQEWGVKYALHQKKVLLGDEMGLGKTVQAIATMVSLKNTGATHFAVVCPASVLTNWCREIRKHSMLRVTKIHGQDRLRALEDWIRVGDVAVTTYETTAHLALEDDFRFTLLVVDEAHYIKNPEAIRTIAVKRLCEHADRLLFMTGTALENKVDEMISLVGILQPEVAAKIEKIASLSTAPKFREQIAPVYYRRKRDDVLTELPELTDTKEWCTMSREEWSRYSLAVMSKNYADMRQVSWHVENIKDSSKAKRMLEIVEEAEKEGRKIIVFSFFLDTIARVREVLGDRCMAPINGSVPVARRQEILDEFEKAPAGAVLTAQIQSGGTGLNIQSASVVILCEPQFKPSVENQAIARAYRMGQTRNVLVYRLLCENTVDERIMEILEEKQRDFDAFADTSVAAQESLELDEKDMSNIVQAEIDRINEQKSR